MWQFLDSELQLGKREEPHPEWVDQVVDTPCDDHVVVTPDDDCDDRRPDPDPSEPGVDLVPDSERSLPELLADGKLQKHKRHAFQHHHDQEREDKRSWSWIEVKTDKHIWK